MKKISDHLRAFVHNEDGATAIEYALLASLIGVSCILAFTLLGNGLQSLFGTDSDGLKGAVDGARDSLDN